MEKFFRTQGLGPVALPLQQPRQARRGMERTAVTWPPWSLLEADLECCGVCPVRRELREALWLWHPSIFKGEKLNTAACAVRQCRFHFTKTFGKQTPCWPRSGMAGLCLSEHRSGSLGSKNKPGSNGHYFL